EEGVEVEVEGRVDDAAKIGPVANVIGGAPIVGLKIVLVGGEAVCAGRIGPALAKQIVSVEDGGFGVVAEVDVKLIAPRAPGGLVLVDVLQRAEWAASAVGVAGRKGSGKRSVDVAREQKAATAIVGVVRVYQQAARELPLKTQGGLQGRWRAKVRRDAVDVGKSGRAEFVRSRRVGLAIRI